MLDQLNRDDRVAPPRKSMAERQAARHRFYVAQAVADASALIIAFTLAGLLRPTAAVSSWPVLGLVMAPVTLLFAFNNGSYGWQALADWKHGLGRVLLAAVQAFAMVLVIAFAQQSAQGFSRLVLTVGFALTVLGLTFGRWMLHRRIKSWQHNLLNELVILDRCTMQVPAGVDVLDAQVAQLTPDPRDPMMLDRLGQVVRGADYVLVCCPPEDRAGWAHLLKGTDVTSHVLMPEFDSLGGSRIGRFHGQPVMEVSTGALPIRARVQKRAFDLLLTVPAIILLSPLLLVTAAAIKLDSPGPIFFIQPRLGRGNRLFRMYKFRSMRWSDRDEQGERSTQRVDTRITRVGRIIRATSIDELPQLFNVLHGDMSLVGPRPHALGSTAGVELFWDIDQRYWHRHALKPGITGLAQVRGFRGATLQREDLVKRLQSDLEYFEYWSIWRDVVILFSTARVLVHRNAF